MNPALNDKAFRSAATGTDRMTITGAVNKSFILVALVFATAIWTWQNTFPSGWSAGSQPVIPTWYFGVIIGTLILAMVIIFKKTWAPFLAPVYALAEGMLLGTISALFEYRYPGIVIQAVLGTATVLISLLAAYRSGLIEVTENFKLGVAAATGGIFLIYLLTFILGFFGMNVPYIHEAGLIGIGFSVFVCIVAALNLVLDFDFIEQGAAKGAPKYMEWYAAFGLLVTLIWLYLEILRLLAKTRSR
tara:strand:- start:23194 stop:23931 length:738 start_codon:yes stop_codon:yes gene_type:complete